MFFINVPHHFFSRDHNGNKVAQLFCVMSVIAPYGEVFYYSFNLNENIFVYVVNIKSFCDNNKYLLITAFIFTASKREHHPKKF